MKDLEALRKKIERDIKRHGGSQPGGFYDIDYDSFWYFNEDVPHYTKRGVAGFDFFLAEKDERVVGISIFGAREFLRQAGASANYEEDKLEEILNAAAGQTLRQAGGLVEGLREKYIGNLRNLLKLGNS